MQYDIGENYSKIHFYRPEYDPCQQIFVKIHYLRNQWNDWCSCPLLKFPVIFDDIDDWREHRDKQIYTKFIST